MTQHTATPGTPGAPRTPGEPGADAVARPAAPHLAAAGTTAVLLFLVSLATWVGDGPADTEVTARTAQQWFVENQPALRVLRVAGVVTAGLTVVLAVQLRRLLRAVAPDSVLPDVALLGGTLVAVHAWLFAAIHSLTTVTDVGAVDPALALSWYGQGTVTESLGDATAMWRGLFVGAVALVAYRTRLLPRAVTWFGLAVAAANLVAVLVGVLGWGPLVALWFAGLFGAYLWPLVLGVALLVRSRRDGRPAPVRQRAARTAV